MDWRGKNRFLHIETHTDDLCDFGGHSGERRPHLDLGFRLISGWSFLLRRSESARKTPVGQFKKKYFMPDEDRWVQLTVSAAGMRTINKKGVEVALTEAKEKGFIDKY